MKHGFCFGPEILQGVFVSVCVFLKLDVGLVGSAPLSLMTFHRHTK